MEDLSSFPVVVERKVSWGDMDAFQHVNNVKYFRFFEDARIAYFEAMEIYDAAASPSFDGVGPILAATSCRFKAPLQYPDAVEVGARVDEVGETRLSIEYAIRSGASGRIAAVGDSEVVTYDYADEQPVEVPEEWRRAIERLES